MAHKYTNRLIHETSPYLQQHAHNPVEWHPWEEDAFARAQAENTEKAEGMLAKTRVMALVSRRQTKGTANRRFL